MQNCKEVSIYIHWPFCAKKCPYCDFNSHVREGVDYDLFLSSYKKELDYFKDKYQFGNIKSIFFGGGTPSTMPVFIVEELIKEISPNNDIEITLEANPSSFEVEKFLDFKKAGINRLSIGIQSFDDQELKFLGRIHDSKDSIRALEFASLNFDKFSFDLIYALPFHNLEIWKKKLDFALNFGAKHMSLYQLTIEKGTGFYSQYKRGEFSLPDEDIKASIYEYTNDFLASNNLFQYETSNYADLNHRSIHNLNYWQYGSYIGIGPGAHSRINKKAIMMIHSPEGWLKRVGQLSNGIMNEDDLTNQQILEEILLMGLRLNDGISDDIFQYYFKKSFQEIFDLEKLIEQRLLEDNSKYLKTTKYGRNLVDYTIGKILELQKSSCYL